MSDHAEPIEDRTNRDGLAALAILALTIVFILAIIVFAIA